MHDEHGHVDLRQITAEVRGLSVAVALLVGTIELGGLVASQLGLSGSFWTRFENIDTNLLRFVIVAMFVAAWVIALAIWRVGRIEERWSGHLERSRAVD